MKIFITGATGYIGSHLIKYLLDVKRENTDITALVRGNNLPWDSNSIHLIRCDLAELSQNIFCNQRYDAAIHLAALMADKDYLPRSEFERVNVKGTEKLIMAIKECRLKQFIHISTVGVYGPTGAKPVGEEDGYGERLSDYEWSKMESEKVAITCCKEAGIPLTILRLGLMYGDGMTYGWPSVVDSIEKGKFRIIGDGESLMQLSYIRDIVEGITLTIENHKSYNSIFNLCGEEVCSISEVFNTVADILRVSRPKKIPFFPTYLLSQILNLIPDFLKGNRLRLITPHRVLFFKENHVYSVEKAKRLLNFHPKYSLKEGMQNMIGSRVGI